MPRIRATACLHEPLGPLLGTQAKVTALRLLARSALPLTHREVVRRSGMAYRSISTALADLLATGVVEELPGGRERRVQLAAGHRLGPLIAALFRAEADFFPSLRLELKSIAAGGDTQGLRSVALVGAVAGRREALGEAMDLVLVSSDAAAAGYWKARFEAAADTLLERFGAKLNVIGYDVNGAQKLWQTRTPRAEEMVRGAEQVFGDGLLAILQGTVE